MDKDYQKILSVLSTLRTESMQCPRNGNDMKALIHKYDMLIIGEKFNIIYSMELCHTLKNKFEIQIEIDELNSIIPSLCKNLNMSCEPMKAMNDLSNPVPAAYRITLY